MKSIDMVDQKLRSCWILISREHLGYYCVNNQKFHNLLSLPGQSDWTYKPHNDSLRSRAALSTGRCSQETGLRLYPGDHNRKGSAKKYID